MIISYSNNFSVIRVPKTGSTSLVFYFLSLVLYLQNKTLIVLKAFFLLGKSLKPMIKSMD